MPLFKYLTERIEPYLHRRPVVRMTTLSRPEPLVVGFEPRLIGERFNPFQAWAEGGTGRIFLGSDIQKKTVVVIKQIKCNLSNRNQIIADEVEYNNKCRPHKNICGFLGVYKDNGDDYLVFEVATGKMLGNIFTKKASFPVGEALCIVEQILVALIHIRDRGLVFGDLSCNNVIYDSKTGTVKLIDLGGCVPIGQVSNWFTKGYCSPEQERHESVDQRSDIFSLGLLFKDLLSADSRKTLFSKTGDRRAIPLDVDPRAREIIVKTISLSKNNRYQDLEAVLKAVQELKQALA